MLEILRIYFYFMDYYNTFHEENKNLGLPN